MREVFKNLNLAIELSDDTIMVRDINTGMLLRAKSYRPAEAMEKFQELVKSYRVKSAKSILK